MANLYPYLNFENTKEALEYYEEVFGATNIMRMPVEKEQAKNFGMPEMSDEALANTTIHGGFTVLGANLFCSDSFGRKLESGNQISIMLDVNSEDEKAAKEADEFFSKIAASNTVDVRMPFESQFWGGKMGEFVDKYGISWMLHSQPYSKLGM
ncbi:hypothetical protein MFLO_00045 [Listeria floridensis FSL S10-1187]|uniref:PhnB-like domain-containing protein n=1 Tax=Listeria floridensis FSL S10-1187 TaxID=1265817 RepID=A0ABP3B2R0_9LIST|nr:glyoxalase/bleomycin resistance/extradiol dioxygenase family protein [Listeria floridensis]EUJ33601.1 hypothetical protein MFLO_00045 [Listeria floridensis FSL S10-1187]